MFRRFLSFLIAMMLCFCTAVSFADDDDFPEDEDDEEWFDDEDDSGFDTEEGKVDFRTIAGYDDQGEKFVCGDYVYMLYEDGENAYITTYTGTDATVTVPDTLDGHPVTAIGDFAFNYQQGIETVIVPEGITSLGNMAFFQCGSLRSVVLPDGITLIDENCFGGCKELEEINIPGTVEKVGTFSFLACMKLTEVTFGPAIRDIGSGAFRLCTSLNKVTIPGGDSVTIEEDAFADCSAELQIIRE